MSSYYFYGPTVEAINGTTASFTGNVSSGGQFLAADGTAAAPGYGYTSQATTGIFRPATGVVGLTGAGVEVARFSATLAQVPAASVLTWNGRATLQSPADGQIEVQLNAGGATSLTTGIIFGAKSAAGASLVFSAAGKVRVMTGNQGANGIFEAASYAVTNSGGTTASYAGAGTFEAGVGLGFDDTGSAANAWCTLVSPRANALTKTTAYPVVRVDSGKLFNNTAASGQVVYTLPLTAVGVSYSFQNTAAGATFTQLLATTPDVFASNGVVGAAAGTMTSTQIWSMITVTCFVAGTWQITSLNGAWTLA